MTQKHAVYEWLQADYESNRNGQYDVVGYRSDMRDIVDWVNYCMTWKPIPLDKFDGMCGEAMAGRTPWPKGNLSPSQMLAKLPETPVFESIRDAIKKYKE